MAAASSYDTYNPDASGSVDDVGKEGSIMSCTYPFPPVLSCVDDDDEINPPPRPNRPEIAWWEGLCPVFFRV